jgi:hypothetical protein
MEGMGKKMIMGQKQLRQQVLNKMEAALMS